MRAMEHILTGDQTQDDLYKNAAEAFGPSLQRLAGCPIHRNASPRWVGSNTLSP
jgi:hypothetical protein